MARFEIDFLTEYSDEALLDELRRIAALLPEGEPLTKTAFDRLSPKVAAKTIQRRLNQRFTRFYSRRAIFSSCLRIQWSRAREDCSA